VLNWYLAQVEPTVIIWPERTLIESPYEAPETPEIHIDTTAMLIDDAAKQILKQLLGE